MGESAGPELPLVADLVYTPALVRQAYTRAWRQAVGGYYLIEVANLDEALKWAAKIPSAKHGSIEVRPVMFSVD